VSTTSHDTRDSSPTDWLVRGAGGVAAIVALVLMWSRDELERIGELALLPPIAGTHVLGRGGDLAPARCSPSSSASARVATRARGRWPRRCSRARTWRSARRARRARGHQHRPRAAPDQRPRLRGRPRRPRRPRRGRAPGAVPVRPSAAAAAGLRRRARAIAGPSATPTRSGSSARAWPRGSCAASSPSRPAATRTCCSSAPAGAARSAP
jgi:hypothetical protein